MINKKIELVAPGGSINKAKVACLFGADAVYIGVPYTSLRMRQNKVVNFEVVEKTIKYLHENNTKVYLTMNIFPKNNDIKIFEKISEKIIELCPDGIIFSDPGTYRILKKNVPTTPLHLSTQANTLNYETASFWYDLGVKRIVLSRELSIKHVEEIKNKLPDLELEVFVHGAMCIAYSGRCFLGEYFSGRDGNKGECSHVCRYDFKVYIEEERRKGKLIEVGNDENGGFLLSSKDLCLIDKIKDLIGIVDALKIEGRSKSEFYVGGTVLAYRNMIDSLILDKPVDENIKNLVNEIPHRQYWEGFLFSKNHPDSENQDDQNQTYLDGVSLNKAGPIKTKIYFGFISDEILEFEGKKYFKIIVKDNIVVGDKFKILSRSGIFEGKIEEIINSNFEKLEKLNCNIKNGYIKMDYNNFGIEVLYR